jgi:hypothetical protein
MKHQGDAMQPTHIDKNKELEWVKKQRKQKDAMLPSPWNNKNEQSLWRLLLWYKATMEIDIVFISMKKNAKWWWW